VLHAPYPIPDTRVLSAVSPLLGARWWAGVWCTWCVVRAVLRGQSWASELLAASLISNT
jgi:hypothetical protein